MINLLYRGIFALLIFKLLMTMYQRKYSEVGGRKRLVSLYQSLFIGVIYIAMSALLARGLSKYLILVVLSFGIVAGIILRKKLFPYTTRCTECQSKLKIDQILFIDSNKCSNCGLKD